MVTKKEIINKLISELDKRIPISYTKKNTRKNTVRYYFEDNCHIEFLFDSVMGGKNGKGSFVLSFSMGISNPFFSKIRYSAFGLDYIPEKDIYNLVIYLSYLNNLPKEWNVYDRYLFSEERDYNDIIKIILDDLQSYFFPYIHSFIQTDYSLLLENYSNVSFVKNIGNWCQFIYGAIASLLANNESFIDRVLIPMAKANTNKIDFLEFKKAEDCRKELVEPIKNYLLKECIIGNVPN